jgi:hypothetical protein
MPQPEGASGFNLQSHLESGELCYNLEAFRQEVTRGETCLNEGQRKIWDKVNHAFEIVDRGGQPEL